jgi:hypothetical protein
MAERTMHTEKWNSGQQSNAKGEKGDAVKVKAKMARVRNAGNPDPLTQSLIPPVHILANTVHFMHSAQPKSRGASYSPAGEYGRPTTGKSGKTKATNPMGGSGGRGSFGGNY